jgi:hypothetical protein
MPSTADFQCDWCSHAAALFACRRWHYSRSLPAGKSVKVGCKESHHFIGALIFSRGNTPHIGGPFGLPQDQVVELTRVALDVHHTPTSRIVAVALRLLRKQSPGLRLVVSYADPAHGHVGILYQAGGWGYVGRTRPESLIRLHGRLLHPRTVGSRYGHRGVLWLRRHIDSRAERIILPPKHKYVFPLDAAMREQVRPLLRPYPKRERSADSGTAVPTAGGGAHPTRSLHHEEAVHV